MRTTTLSQKTCARSLGGGGGKHIANLSLLDNTWNIRRQRHPLWGARGQVLCVLTNLYYHLLQPDTGRSGLVVQVFP